jgi:hypothetical protein
MDTDGTSHRSGRNLQDSRRKEIETDGVVRKGIVYCSLGLASSSRNLKPAT